MVKVPLIVPSLLNEVGRVRGPFRREKSARPLHGDSVPLIGHLSTELFTVNSFINILRPINGAF